MDGLILDTLLERKHRSSGLQVDLAIYENACNDYNDLRESTKQKYFNDAVLECDGDHGKMFFVINRLLHRVSSSPLPMADSHSQLANDFAEYFEGKIIKNSQLTVTTERNSLRD